MATGAEVLTMLCPGSEWVISGNDYNSIQWIKGSQVTEKEFDAGFAQFDAWKAQQESDKASVKSDLLARLGITEDEAKILLA
jgi:hypothetical protein